MSFHHSYVLKNNSIEVLRGRYREENWYEPCFEGAPDMCKKVYALLESVYNMGELDGRKYVRRAVKDALDIDL